jgi:hypothetical protein
MEKRLLEIARQLPAAQAEALLEFAEFLLTRHGVVERVLPEVKESAMAPVDAAPLDIPRPANESVVKAIKRLRATYHMLDVRKLLNQTSDLMTEHVVKGRDKVEVIEELEILFRTHYEEFTGNNK